MWPWEHVVVGYVAYSLFVHLAHRDSPGALDTVAVVVASVLPDLIDKPLAWEFGVFESGYALGHSILFAIPLAIVVGLATSRLGRPRVGIAFAVGYLLHLPADVLDGYVRGGHLDWGILLWPVETGSGYHQHGGFLDQFEALLAQYRAELLSGDPSTYVLAQLGLAAFAVVLWLADGAPVVREAIAGSVRLVRSALAGAEPSSRR